MSIEGDQGRRRRRTPEVARAEALAAARELLLEGGPDAVTLKAVAAAMGVTHANLIHRFGSAAGLDAALMAELVSELAEGLRGAVAAWSASGGSAAALVEPAFAAFSQGGGGALAARIALGGDLTQLEPVRAALTELMDTLTAALPDAPDVHQHVAKAVLLVALLAFGDAVIGDPVRAMLGLPRDAARDLTVDVLSTYAANAMRSR